MEDRQLLDSRTQDIEQQVERIADEFRAGFEHVAQIDRPAVALFGSARVGEDHPAYVAARETGRRFAERNWAVVTGGGPGVATETISVYIYKVTTQDLIWGYVAAIALAILIVLSILLPLLQLDTLAGGY